MLGLLLEFSTPNLPQASTMAGSVDTVYAFIYWVSVICFIAIVGAGTWFVFKYRRKTENDPTPYIEGHSPTEIGISVALFILVMGLFWVGWVDFMKMRTSPMNAYEVNVIGQQWSWDFQYANGKRFKNELHIPANTPIKLIMTSSDVLHSFYIPAFRLKRDVIPGTYQYLAFTANMPGEYDIYCAEYCGLDHSQMLGKVIVMDPAVFAHWEDGVGPFATKKDGGKSAPKSLVEMGQELFVSKTCSACHSNDGTTRVGPTFKGLFGKNETTTDGKSVTVDEAYIRESMMDPNKVIVKGFVPGTMPTFAGQLSDDDVNALVAYIKSLQ